MQTHIQYEQNGRLFALIGYPSGAFVPLPNVGDSIESGFDPGTQLKVTNRTFSYSNIAVTVILHVDKGSARRRRA